MTREYFDSDLMTLKKFSQFGINGYYLLKAKLDGIIDYIPIFPNINKGQEIK